MKAPACPPDEALRLDTLRALNILDTESEERFDRLTRLARRLFDVPIAIVSLVDADRQWFKSVQGLEATETPRAVSFCGHAILGDDIFLVTDAAQDERFHDNPFVTGAPNVRFYAGCPLTVPNGSRLGTLCLIDREPRQFDAADRALRRDLASMAERELASMQLATTDELTSLTNRRGFDTLANHVLSVCRRTGRPATLLYFDLDAFKQINDRWGHAEGDRALREFASVLKQRFRESDLIARIGGDEFAALLFDTGMTAIDPIVAELRQALDATACERESGSATRFSVGAVAYAPARHPSLAVLVDEADARMYEQKRAAMRQIS